MKKIIRKIVDYCIPPQCMLCGSQSEDSLSLCEGCKQDLPWLKSVCFKCALPLPTNVSQCGACLNNSALYHRTIALFHYDDLIARCISALKFRRCLVVGHVFGTLMSQVLHQRYYDD